MPTDPLIQRINLRYDELRQSGHPGTSYPDDFKAMVASYAHRCRRDGANWKQISSQIPVSSTTARIWIRRQEPGSMVPVLVSVASPMVTPVPVPATPALTLTSPNGFRLAGFDLAQAAELMARLG